MYNSQSHFHYINSKNNYRSTVGYFTLCFFLVYATTVQGNTAPLSQKKLARYNLMEEPLTEFLSRFFSENNMRATLSHELEQDKRTLNGPRSGSPKDIFHSIERSNSLASYYDGHAIFIYKANEITQQFYTIDHNRIAQLKRSIQRLDGNNRSNSIRIDSETGLTEVNGVPRYQSRFRQLMRAVIQKSGETVFRYYPLKYAWATDRTFTAGGKEVTISGVANIMKEVIHGGTHQSYATGRLSNDKNIDSRLNGMTQNTKKTSRPGIQSNTRQHQSLRGANDTFSNSFNNTLNNTSNNSLHNRSSHYPSQSQANIVADPQHNAIIIRDTKDRIPLYEDLLATLDIPTQIIEIKATIIDVNIDKLKSSGVEWRYGKSDRESLFASAGTKSDFLKALSGGSIANVGQVPGLQLGAIVGNRNQFIARLNLLESKGVLSVSSRPTVSTLNDLEAVIESSRSLYVPVSGAYDAELFEVFTGTVLKVTPHTIDTSTGIKIRLIVSVEDGIVDTTGYNGNPITTRNAVSTQTIIQAGHSLLLGGLVHEQQRSQQHKVPLLGDIPLLGRLFRSKSTTSIHTERLFLISPRILSTDGSEQHLTTENQSHSSLLKSVEKGLL
ncbi:MAG: type III secretion system outer membrane ring subunit SctC [Pseudomonadales bacterium]|nr:type III secretion system outer membrane ring subunit SctC [Pseudomonadales bacterium]